MSMLDGIISGLDTTGVINELLAASRAPVTRLTSRQTTANSQATTLGNIRSLADAAKASVQLLDSANDWRSAKATTSDATIATVTVGTNPSPAALSFTVDRLAQSHQLVTSGAALAADVEWATSDLVVEVGGINHAIVVAPDTGSGVRDLDSVVEAINAADLGIRAAAVQVAPGEYRLQIEAGDTGADSEFSVVSGLVPAMDISRQGQDARIVLAGGVYDATSPTNTFDELVPGLDVTVKKISTDVVTVAVATDPDALATKVQALVNAVNSAVTSVKTATAYNTTTGTASVLTGDATVRRLGTELSRSLMDPVSGSSLGAPGLAGITLKKDGTLSFDKAKFLEAYDADPQGVQDLFVAGDSDTPGIAERLVKVVDLATAVDTGYLRTAEQSRKDRVTRIAAQITKMETRIEREAVMLRKKFAAMETSLSSLQQQGNWLSGQLASLQPSE